MGHPYHKKAFQVQIGSLTLGEVPKEWESLAEPNPVKITWSKTNIIKVHEIPHPKHKTLRAAKETLWTCRMSFRTNKENSWRKMVEMINDVGPHLIRTGTQPSPMQMYITDCSFSQIEGHEDDHIEWELSLLEVND